MQTTRQQQIIVYFIEEAKEHLDTIEQGLLSLQDTLSDTERLNELFRAAHSVKGGAAMLGFGSIQRISHHLEDCFKLLNDYPAQIDQRTENLFFQGFDVLKELIEALRSPYGLREQDANQMVRAAEPTFAELQRCLKWQASTTSDMATPPPLPLSERPNIQPHDLGAVINAALKKMLQYFKQRDTRAGRQQLMSLCIRMTKLHTSPEWCRLLQLSQDAIANPKTPYQVLAPTVIKELKCAGDLLVAGRASEITVSKHLWQLALTSHLVANDRSQSTSQSSNAAAESQSVPSPQSITIPADPRSVAKVLLDTFNREQLIELAESLMKAIQ